MPAQVIITEPAQNVVEVHTSNSSVSVTETTNTVVVNATTVTNGGQSSSALFEEIAVTNSIGDALAGNQYPAGTTFETIVRDLIAPFLEPEILAVTPVLSGETVFDDTGAILVQCGLSAILASVTITWKHPENIIPDSNTAFTDLSSFPSVIYTYGIGPYDALPNPYTLAVNYALPANTSPLTRSLEVRNAYYGDNGTGSVVQIAKQFFVKYRFRTYVVASYAATFSTVASLLAGGDAVYSSLLVDSTADSNVISVPCTSDTADTAKYTWLIIPAKGVLSAAAAEVSTLGVADYTDSFVAYTANGAGYSYSALPTGATNYFVYRSVQPGAFDSDVTLKLTITY